MHARVPIPQLRYDACGGGKLIQRLDVQSIDKCVHGPSYRREFHQGRMRPLGSVGACDVASKCCRNMAPPPVLIVAPETVQLGHDPATHEECKVEVERVRWSLA